LDFESLRILERQFGHLGEHTLLFVVQTYGGPSDVRSANLTADVRSANLTTDVRGTTGHMLLFGIPVVNTWMYEIAFGTLENSTGHMLAWPDVRYFCQGISSSPLL
jgi:hypothetical protein